MMSDKQLGIYKIYPTNSRYIELWTWHKYSFIIGNSGSGKSYVCKRISELKADKYYLNKQLTTIDIDTILVWRDNRDIDKTVSNKLIIVDRFDKLIEKDQTLWDFIVNSSNKFILMSYEANYKSLPGTIFFTLKTDQEHIWMEPYRI